MVTLTAAEPEDVSRVKAKARWRDHLLAVRGVIGLSQIVSTPTCEVGRVLHTVDLAVPLIRQVAHSSRKCHRVIAAVGKLRRLIVILRVFGNTGTHRV